MRSMELQEIDVVSGGWDVSFDFGIVDINVTGEDFVNSYNWAVGQMTDFFTWWDPNGYYSACGY